MGPRPLAQGPPPGRPTVFPSPSFRMTAYSLDKLIMLLFGLAPATEIANYRRSGLKNHGQLKQAILNRYEFYGKDSRGHQFCLQQVTTTTYYYYHLLLLPTTTVSITTYYLLVVNTTTRFFGGGRQRTMRRNCCPTSATSTKLQPKRLRRLGG